MRSTAVVLSSQLWRGGPGSPTQPLQLLRVHKDPTARMRHGGGLH